jgi:hypothetical protein
MLNIEMMKARQRYPPCGKLSEAGEVLSMDIKNGKRAPHKKETARRAA